ncbi:hypothetical protein [Caballeronia concitans]|uniref:Lipoprotein n=1 Tax=Caballeronia concitans TaxID=1777133 RepID=A0A658R5C5_9BURK|nr:hypothetical protein [Caballeronia concitans]SAL52327.1 hypothetical protein AWB72_05568 [Caballeronia concitans]
MNKFLCVLLLAASLTGCDSGPASTGTSSESAPSSTSSASSSSVSNTADTEPDDATKARCRRVGALAYKIAAARSAGVPAETTFNELLDGNGEGIDPPTVLTLMKQLYIGFAKQMAPDGARSAYYVDCLVMADAKSIDGQTNIATALAPFKTYTGEPLQKVLARQHITVAAITVQPVKTLREGDQKGDELYSLVLHGRPPKKAPCSLHDFSSVDENVSEVIRRGPSFRQDKPTDLDLVLYWAATGKCNPEY